MYRHILIPTDGSELAEHAVTNGLSLAKSVGAKVTVIIVEEPFNWQSVSEAQAQWALEELHQTYRSDREARCECAESRGRCGQAGWCALRHDSGEGRVSLSSHHCNGRGQGLRSHRHGIARAQRTIRNCARQCYKQGADAHENPGVGVSLNAPAAVASEDGQCPLWVKSRHLQCKTPCPLYPQLRHRLRIFRCPLRAKKLATATSHLIATVRSSRLQAV